MRKIFKNKFLVLSLGFIALPLILSTYYVNILSLFLIMGILALSLDLIWGYTGILSFGQGAFFGLGGYTYAITAMNLMCNVEIKYLSHYTVTNQGGTTYIPVLLGIILPVILAMVLGYFLFYARVSGVYFCIITLSLTLILQQITMQLVEHQIGNIPLGGFNGITYVPRISIGIPLLFYYSLDGPNHFYYFVLFCSVLSLVICKKICNSPFGSILTAIRDNEIRTESFGYDIRKYKMIVFTISGALAGLSGLLYCSWGSFISPWAFDFFLSAETIIWVLIGGKGTLIGAFVGAFLTQFLENLLSDILIYYWLLIMGVVFIVIVLLFPKGIMGIIYGLKRSNLKSS
jgi:urea ABC transporter permease protein UrtC